MCVPFLGLARQTRVRDSTSGVIRLVLPEYWTPRATTTVVATTAPGRDYEGLNKSETKVRSCTGR